MEGAGEDETREAADGVCEMYGASSDEEGVGEGGGEGGAGVEAASIILLLQHHLLSLGEYLAVQSSDAVCYILICEYTKKSE